MKVLIVGSGGREHALAWKCAQSPKVAEVLVAPGNGGTATEAARAQRRRGRGRRRRSRRARAEREGRAHHRRTRRRRWSLGVVDAVLGRAACAASARARPPRSSKAPRRSPRNSSSATAFPTAAYATFTKANFDAAWVRAQRTPIVVKASGLAAGKGVIICDTADEAIATAARRCSTGSSAPPGDRVVIEEFLPGEEASFIVMADGKNILPMATSQDHKRLLRRRRRPQHRRHGRVFARAGGRPRDARTHHARGHRADDPRARRRRHAVHRVPVRGDHGASGWHAERARIQLPLRRSGNAADHDAAASSDLVALCEAALAGRLDRCTPTGIHAPRSASCWRPEGYPDDVRKGDVITGLDARGATTRQGVPCRHAARRGTRS